MSTTTHPTDALSARSVRAYAAQSATSPLAPWSLPRRAVRPTDVAIDILFCGVCHSDLHTARGQWPGITFPVVPGHEIIGRVRAVGQRVERFRIGQLVGVGCMVDSCRACAECAAGLEQYCVGAPGRPATVFTYNSPDPLAPSPGLMTYGGYSQSIVVDEAFVLRIPDTLDPAAAAPLLCAGITTWSPLRRWGIGVGHRVGVVGLGGLGHMAVKLARALGAEPIVFTTSPGKIEEARRLGAAGAVISRDQAAMERLAGTLDFIIDTVGVSHSLDPYTTLLRRDGTLCLVGAPESPHPPPSIWNLILRRRAIAGSCIGGIRETQELLDFCGRHAIVSDIEIIPISAINDAYERMLRGDVRYRFVIDLSTL
jgi:uncharacterized zinc-type alcohol dehydrogenase-like protein